MQFLKTLLFIGFLIIAGIVGAQDATPVPPCYDPDLGWWVYNNDVCSIQEEITVTLKVDIRYPQSLAEQSPFAAEIMQTYLQKARDATWDNAESGFGWGLFAAFPVYEVKIDYQVFSYSQNITTVVFTSISSGGQGHGPVPHFQSFTFDLRNEKVLALEDIFREGVNPYQLVSFAVREQLRDQVPPQYFERLDVIDQPWLYPGWALTPDNLEFFFSGELTGEYGEDILYRVSIPLKDLKDSLRPEFIPQRA